MNSFPSFIRPPAASRLLIFVCFFNDKVNTNRKNKAFWRHMILVVVWHLRAIMGNRDPDHPQTQLCFSGQGRLVELSLQACSGGLGLGGGWSRIQHSGGIRPGDVNSALPVGNFQVPCCHLSRGGSLLAVRSSSHKSWISLVLQGKKGK